MHNKEQVNERSWAANLSFWDVWEISLFQSLLTASHSLPDSWFWWCSSWPCWASSWPAQKRSNCFQLQLQCVSGSRCFKGPQAVQIDNMYLYVMSSHRNIITINHIQLVDVHDQCTTSMTCGQLGLSLANSWGHFGKRPFDWGTSGPNMPQLHCPAQAILPGFWHPFFPGKAPGAGHILWGLQHLQGWRLWYITLYIVYTYLTTRLNQAGLYL